MIGVQGLIYTQKVGSFLSSCHFRFWKIVFPLSTVCCKKNSGMIGVQGFIYTQKAGSFLRFWKIVFPLSTFCCIFFFFFCNVVNYVLLLICSFAVIPSFYLYPLGLKSSSNLLAC